MFGSSRKQRKPRGRQLTDVLRRNIKGAGSKAPAPSVDVRKHLYPIKHSSQN